MGKRMNTQTLRIVMTYSHLPSLNEEKLLHILQSSNGTLSVCEN